MSKRGGGPHQKQLPGWGELPPQQPNHQLGLNFAPLAPMVQDLKELPLQDDPMEMVIDLAQGFEQEAVLQIAPPVQEQTPPNNQPPPLLPAQLGQEIQMPIQFQAMILDEEILMDLDEMQQQIDQEQLQLGQAVMEEDQNLEVQQIEQGQVQADLDRMGDEENE